MFPTINMNKENVSGSLPQPNVKIIDLYHNLLPFDGLNSVQSTGEQIMSDGGMRIDAQTLRN